MLKEAAVLALATATALSGAAGVMRLAHPAQAEARAFAPSARITKAADGHFWAKAEVSAASGTAQVRFLVDTGASSVALTLKDATRLGVDPGRLAFDHPVSTAQGPAQAALIVLPHLEVAGARVDRVEALVLKRNLPASLLGMSYLGRLSRLEATPTVLTLTK